MNPYIYIYIDITHSHLANRFRKQYHAHLFSQHQTLYIHTYITVYIYRKIQFPIHITLYPQIYIKLFRCNCF